MQDHRKLSFCMGDDEVVESSSVYYCTEKGKIKGVLEVSSSRIFFEPLACKENGHITNLRPFQVCIDMGDVITTQKVKLPNESGDLVIDQNQAKNYMYDYFLQINLAAVNQQGRDKE